MAIVAASDLPFGQCRCCLNFGYHKHISKPYYTNGIRQIYQDIFLECFNLLLDNTELTDLICKACIRQLLDASEFKSMVVESERRLISDLGGSNIGFVNVNKKEKVEKTKRNRKSKNPSRNYEINVNNVTVEQNGKRTVKTDNNGMKWNVETIHDDGSIKNEDKILQNGDEILQNDYEILQNDDDTLQNDDDTLQNADDTLQNDDDTLQNADDTLQNDDDTLQNDDDTLQNDDDTLQNDDEYYDSAATNDVQDDENFVLLIVGDEKVGTEEATTHKMFQNASSPCHCSDCNPTDHNYARPQQETKNAYSASLRPRKAVKNIPDDDPIKLASESPEDDQTDSDWHDSNSGDDNKKTHRKSKQDDVKEGDLKKYTNEDIRLESMLKYSCTLCKYVTNNSVHYQKHLDAHTAPNAYVCDICCYIARKKILLHYHLLKHSGVKRFACDICNKKFIFRTRLRSHMRTHTGEKPYSCKHCDKTFGDNGQLYSHIMRTHTDEKRFTCKICHKKFASSFTYKSHLRTHYSRELVVCEICNKKVLPTSLPRHISRHTNSNQPKEKSHSCDLCDYKSANISDLRRHFNVHVKPYACDVCNKKFARNARLRDHYFTAHTNEKPYPCKLCKNKRFPSKMSLYTHMSSRHKRKKSCD